MLVDADNIAFFRGRLDGPCLHRRIRAIHDALQEMGIPSAAVSMEYFCNPATFAFLRGIDFPALGDVRPSSSNDRDSADHLLLRRFEQVQRCSGDGVEDVVLVITHDKVLARLVRYLDPPRGGGSLRFGTFGRAASSCDRLDIHLPTRFGFVFNGRTDLDSFMLSLHAFRSGPRTSPRPRP